MADEAENKVKTTGLDLGFADLLEPAKSETSRVAAEQKLSSTEGTREKEPEETQPAKSSYARLAESSSWKELTLLCEKEISEKEKGLERAISRIWWVRAQHAQDSMPLSILAAPLQSALNDISESKQTLDLETKETLEVLVKDFNKVDSSYLEPTVVMAVLPALSAVKPELEKNSAAKSEQPAKSSSSNEEELPRAENATNLPKKVMLFGALLVVFSLLYSEKINLFPISTEPLPALVTTSPLIKIEPLVPDVGRIGVTSHLDALVFDLEGGGIGPREEAPSSTQPSKTGLASAAVVRPQSRSRRRELERVNTSGPVEPDNLMAARSKSETQKSFDRMIEKSRRVTPLSQPAPHIGSRVGAPASVRAVLGYSEDNFSKPEVYKVVTETEVMAKPSNFTAPLSILRVGDRVMVSGKVGPWLKVQSRQGRVGYVRGQDLRRRD